MSKLGRRTLTRRTRAVSVGAVYAKEEGLAVSQRLFLFGDDWALRRQLSVQLGVWSPFFWQVVFVEDRLNRTLGNAGFAVNTFVGMNVDHRFAFVEAFNRANDNAICVLAIETGFGNNVGHECPFPNGYLLSFGIQTKDANDVWTRPVNVHRCLSQKLWNTSAGTTLCQVIAKLLFTGRKSVQKHV